MARSKNLEVLRPTDAPEWGMHTGYAFCDVYGGKAVLFSSRQQGWLAGDPAPSSQHPNKVNPGGTVRYLGTE
jgi:hypothetical protein